PRARYLGVESHLPAAEKAAQRMERVVRGEADSISKDQLGIETGTVDCLVYGAVLEHLIDPWGLLQRQAAWLRPGGMVLACIPNVQHWSLLVELLRGRWRYQDEGLLDRTHLRFFTREGALDLMSRAGLEVCDIQQTVLSSPEFPSYCRLLTPL